MERPPFQVLCDSEGTRYVLIKWRPPLWVALKLKPIPALVLLSDANLDRMQIIGRATWER